MADSDELKIKVSYEVDDTALNQSLAKIQSNTSKALSGGSGGGAGGGGGSQTAIDKTLQQANKLQDRLNLLKESFSRLAAQGGQERQLAKVSQELANQYSQYKNMAKTSSDYLGFLEREVALRKQATQLTTQANKDEGVYSAHSQRQFAMLQQIAGQVPGGGLLNHFLSGARQGAMASEAAGGSGSMLSGGALAGGAMTAGIAAAAAGIALVTNKMGEMASRAQELAQSASSATSSLGQLRSQTERTKIQSDANAVSGGVTIAGIQQFIGQAANSVLGGAVNALVGKTPQSKQADIAAAINGGLGGDDKETWRRIKEQGQDTNLDLARQRQSLDIQQQRQLRDFALEQKSWQIDVANTRFDLQKQAQRQEQDYTLAKRQYDENFAGNMAKRQFDLQQEFAQKSYQIQQQRAEQDYQVQRQRAQQDFGISQSDRAYDYNLSRSRASQDFGISQSDRAYDYNLSRSRGVQDFGISRSDKQYDFQLGQSRNQQEFDINRGRQGEDYQENLMKMALSGADAKSYLFAAMDFRKSQQREIEDFNRQKAIAQQDYSISTSRETRDFNLNQSRGQEDYNLGVRRDTRNFNLAQTRGQEDYNLGVSRDTRNFNLSQQRGAQDFTRSQERMGQDFSMQQQMAMAEREMQIETELYNRKYQGIQLELQHNRNLEDESIALQRFNQSLGLQTERFGNQASDIRQDQSLANRDFNIQAYRALRQQGYNEQDFAGQLRKDNPLAAYGQSLSDPEFAAALARNAAATGQLPLSDQMGGILGNANGAHAPGGGVLAALGTMDLGNIIGQSIVQSIPGLSLVGGLMQLFGGGGGGGNSQGVGTASFNPVHNVTFPTVGGVSQADLQALQQKQQEYMRALAELDAKYASALNSAVGVSSPGFPSFYGY